MDGIESNDGIFVVASTNFLDKLDPGLTKRPSRFDRKFLFPLPNEHERKLYCEFWRQKLQKNKTNVDFPKKLLQPMAHITPGFSFAFLQECFVATMLALARKDDKAGSVRPFDGDNDDLDDYDLWVAFKKQAEALRKEIDSQQTGTSQLAQWCRANAQAKQSREEIAAIPTSEAATHHCHCRRENGDEGSVTSKLGRLDLDKDEVLPELPYFDRKSSRLTPTAFEKRL